MTSSQTHQLARSSNTATGANDFGPVELLRLVSRCECELRRTISDRIRPWGINDVELLVLWLCDEAAEPGIAQSELVANIGVSAAQMSGLVDRLRQQGMLTGKRCNSDRRRQYWSLAGDGKRVLDEIRAELTFVSVGLTRHLSVNEQRLLASLLLRLTQAAKQPLTLRTVAAETMDHGKHRDVHDDNTEKDD